MSELRTQVFNLMDMNELKSYEDLQNRAESGEIKITRDSHTYTKGAGGVTEALITVWWKTIEDDI